MWQNSIRHEVYSSLLPPEQSGWIKDGDHYDIEWEASKVMERIKRTISSLTKSCSCKIGQITVGENEGLVIVDQVVYVKDVQTYQ